MAFAGTMTQRNSLTVKDHLKVNGTGISPRVSRAGADDDISRSSDVCSSRPSSGTSGEIDPEEAYSMLQGVVNMNRTLEGQIDALRLRLDVESKHHVAETQKIVRDKNREIEDRENEIEGLKDSLVNRDERIHVLVRSTNDKDKVIHEKSGELDQLKQLVKQTEDYASRLYRQVSRLRDDKRHLESDTLYKEQNNEIQKLRHELKQLKEKCVTMETELDRAKNIIIQQNNKIAKFENEKNEMARNFKEELDKASRAMRQEVERMREVMNQNYEEMRNLREQNKAMHDDVRDIKDLILQGKTPREEQEEEVQHPVRSGGGGASNINLSTYLMTPEKSQYPPNQNASQRRALEHLMKQVPRPNPSPSPIVRSKSRASINRSTMRSSAAAGASKSAITSSDTTGLPAITFGPREKTRWPSAAPHTDRNKQRLYSATSVKRTPSVSKK